MWSFLASVIKKITFSDFIFGLRAAKSILGTTKNQGIINKLNKAIDVVDSINRVMPNKETEKIAEKINKDNRTWKGFNATLAKDKHGNGNHGIVLGYKNKNIDVKYNPSNGGFEGAFLINN
jgi:hypothetical protein